MQGHGYAGAIGVQGSGYADMGHRVEGRKGPKEVGMRLWGTGVWTERGTRKWVCSRSKLLSDSGPAGSTKPRVLSSL